MDDDRRVAGKEKRAAGRRGAADARAAVGTKGSAGVRAPAGSEAAAAAARRVSAAGRTVGAKDVKGARVSRTRVAVAHAPVRKRGAPDRPTTDRLAVERTVVAAIAVTDRHRLIAQCAYYRAERRGWVAGRELEDWLAAEREIDAMLAARGAAPTAGKP